MPSSPRRGAGYVLRLLVFASMLVVTGTPSFARSELIESVALMEDPTASLGIGDVMQQDFQPAGQTVSLGYSKSAHWLRLRILPASDGGEVVVLFGPASPDSLNFFSPASASARDAASPLNDDHASEISPDWPSPQPGFRINPPEGGADYFVRLESAGSIWLTVTAEPASAAVKMTKKSNFVQVAYLSAMFFAMVWALQMFTTTGLNSFAAFAAMQFAWVANNIFYLGYDEILATFLTDEARFLIFRSSVFLASFLTAMFHRSMARRFEPSLLALRLFDVQCTVIAAAFLAFFLFDPVLALQVNAVCLSVMPLVFLANAWTARVNVPPGLLLMRLIYSILGVSFILNGFAVLGLYDSPIIAQYGFMIHGGMTSTLLVAFLHVKAREIAAEARAAEARYVQIEQQNRLEKEKARALSQFMEMLGHEAKNALAVVQMSIPVQAVSESQHARSAGAIRGLLDLIDRFNQVARLDNKEQILSWETCDLDDILQKLISNSDDSTRIILKVSAPSAVRADPVLLNTILGNLLDNACKYAAPGSCILVSVAHESNGCSIYFENEQGPAGMPDPDRVFEKYYRSSGAKSEIGSGLGLYIVHGLVRLIGGRVEYFPRESRVRFKVWLPC